MTDVRSFAVGPIQENAYLVRASADSEAAVLIDPGEEPEKLLAAADALHTKIVAILLTHCHFDHIGAVAPVAKATGAPVYCPALEVPVLTDIMRWVPPGFGPFQSHQPEHTLKGGETLRLAGLHIEVLFTPGHSPGHLTYAITPASDATTRPASDATTRPASDATTRPASDATEPHGDVGDAATQPPSLLSGDVLFEGSVGRVDLPGGDWPTLERSIATLMKRFPPESVVFPGHMGVTTLRRELQSNPFLTELRQQAVVPAATQRDAPAS